MTSSAAEQWILADDFLAGARVEIDADRHARLHEAADVIGAIWAIEEAFSLVAHAFLEVEKTLLGLSLDALFEDLHNRNAHGVFDDIRQGLNLRIVTALSASRVYEDQTKRRISAISKLIAERIDVDSVFSAAFDGSLEYRVMHALRNHALHHQLPLGRVSIGSQSEYATGTASDNGPRRIRTDIDPTIIVTQFCENGNLRPKTRREVEKLGYPHLNLRFFLRGFLRQLADVHFEVRKRTRLCLETALDDLKAAAEEVSAAKGEKAKFVAIYKLSGGVMTSHVSVDYDTKVRLSDRLNHWSALRRIQEGYVSSGLQTSKDTYPRSHSDIWMSD